MSLSLGFEALGAAVSADLVEKVGFFGILILSIAIHEYGHARSALWFGDETAARLGRVTLNPLPHLDPVFSVVVPLFLVLSGSPFLFGAGKPVPVMPSRLRRPHLHMMLVSLAGPAMNLVLAAVLVLVTALLSAQGLVTPTSAGGRLLQVGVYLNVFLAVFNLIPVPPLDGHQVLAFFLPERLRQPFLRAQWLGLFVLAFFFLGPGGRFLLHAMRPLLDLYQQLLPSGYSL